MEMRGKIVLVTGANSGVGLVAARELARLGASVVLICRDQERGKVATDLVAAAATGALPALHVADLSSQAAIRRLVDELGRQFDRVDVLINNAGAIFARRELTVDGIEKTFATNHLAPFLLTHNLLDLLRSAPVARIVNVASDAYPSRLDFSNLQGERRYNFFGAYMRSKLENILFTFELARRLENTRITANCLSPGPTLTSFGDNLSGLPQLFPLIMKNIPFLLRSREEGAKTSIFLASSATVAGISGKYFFRCREHPTKPVTYDRRVAARLWQISEESTGLRATTPRTSVTCLTA